MRALLNSIAYLALAEVAAHRLSKRLYRLGHLPLDAHRLAARMGLVPTQEVDDPVPPAHELFELPYDLVAACVIGHVYVDKRAFRHGGDGLGVKARNAHTRRGNERHPAAPPWRLDCCRAEAVQHLSHESLPLSE